ncbi:MAG: hypothetical protein KatS3mg033_1110 [Thermonema sp.]|uniref:putative type IX sorting system protein PorV2 n=1 Tax=Thermonema sp. TaxID=2231181 RepID=UPI0021DCEA43|nr:hypothetical protein [Thermonema sp.]GIV39310.1 MAG: hypothetical protein KatS3mg033_1110 [Thermonema sp.]
MLRRFVFLLLCSLSGSVGIAQNTPKYSNEFLNIGVNARAMALSNAQTATVSDVTAGYWNPAGLMHTSYQYEGALTHAEYFAGIAQYDYMGFTTNIDSSSRLGVSLIRFGVDDIPDTRFIYDANGAINYNNIRYFSASDYAFLLSYAKKTSVEGLSWGSNFKIIYRQAGDFATAWGFGLDMGMQYRRGQWQFGAMARDITGTYTTWSHNVALLYDVYAQTGNEIPKNSVEITLPRLQVGIARQFRWKQFGILPQIELPLTFDGMRNTLIRSHTVSIDPSLGIELDYQKMVYVRFGAGNFQQIKDFDGSRSWTYQINFGAGFRLKRFTIDYALTDLGDNAEGLYSHVFSLKAGFNK